MKRVLVIGDAILDVYRECTYKKDCPDAPGVQAVVQNSVDIRPGGAANVAVNLAALDPEVEIDLISVMDSRLAFAIKGICGGRVSLSSSVPSDECLAKERVIVDGRLTIRVDNMPRVSEHDSGCVNECLDSYFYATASRRPDLIVLSDYGAGTVSDYSRKLLLDFRDRLLIDTKELDLSVFAPHGGRSLLVKLNDAEWRAAVTRHHSPEEFFDFMVVTRGSSGAELVTQRPGKNPNVSVRRNFSIPGQSVATVDVCGCGDTFMAGMAASLLSGKDMFDSLRFANAAAAVVVGMPRTSVTNLAATMDLLERD